MFITIDVEKTDVRLCLNFSGKIVILQSNRRCDVLYSMLYCVCLIYNRLNDLEHNNLATNVQTNLHSSLFNLDCHEQQSTLKN